MRYYLLASRDHQNILTYWGIFYDRQAAFDYANDHHRFLFPIVYEFNLLSSTPGKNFYFVTTGYKETDYKFGLWAEEEEVFGWVDYVKNLLGNDYQSEEARRMLNAAQPIRSRVGKKVVRVE